MFSKRLHLAFLALGLLVLIAPACQSSQGHQTSINATAVQCDKCQALWASSGTPDSADSQCPDCKSAAANYIATGDFSPSH